MGVQFVEEEIMENKFFNRLFLTCIIVLIQVAFVKAQVEPDTSINRKIFLLNAKSVKKKIGNLMPFLDTTQSLPDIYLSNISKKQYLRLIFHPGGYENAFAMFEVGYVDKKIKIKKVLKLPEFYTERGLKLGMSKDKFLTIMRSYVMEMDSKNGYFIRIEDPKNSFLEMYGLPVYEAKYYFKENILVKFNFGFEYP